ncbi:hypothetical protein [Nocardia ignorata]|uniref:Uncharacterized protein n=1 Tax=Nocardia ignorata TaxID=145285 RepID=A0A4R6NYY0_NOCIG|nr:hypothetical protein [Nocardia ignorata]TDP29743.1 hypothetical protein DFR75_1124 [Nocardia ignorata]
MSSTERIESAAAGSEWDQFDVRLVPASDRALLDALGIIVRPARGSSVIWVDHTWSWWKQVGIIVVPRGGRIEVWPHGDITDRDLAALIGAGCEAFCTPPSRATRWSRCGRIWECVIDVPVTT